MAEVFYDFDLATGANDGSSRANAYRGAGSLQAAINAAFASQPALVVANGNRPSVELITGTATLSVTGGSVRHRCRIVSTDWSSDTPTSNAIQVGARYGNDSEGSFLQINTSGNRNMIFEAMTLESYGEISLGAGSGQHNIFTDCVIKSLSVSARVIYMSQGSRGICDLNGCELNIVNAGTYILADIAAGLTKLRGVTLTGTALTTRLIGYSNDAGHVFDIEDSDFSNMGSGVPLVDHMDYRDYGNTRFHRVKTGASPVYFTTSGAGKVGGEHIFYNVGPSDNPHQGHFVSFGGEATTVTSADAAYAVREAVPLTGHATEYAWEYTPNGDYEPGERIFRLHLGGFESTETANVIRVEITFDDTNDRDDSQIWVEISAPTASDYPNRTLATSENSGRWMGSGATNLPASTPSPDWTNSTMTNQKKRYLEATLSGDQAGWCDVYVCFGLGGTDLEPIYVDPNFTVDGVVVGNSAIVLGKTSVALPATSPPGGARRGANTLLRM